MEQDFWKPEQYNKFKGQRAQPFWDLLNLVQGDEIKTVIDLGCGTGEMTAEIQRRFSEAQVLGVDNSASMLQESKSYDGKNLHFENRDIQKLDFSQRYDLVFSNATLQWLPNHEELFPKILSMVGKQGQFAVQMPYNFDHPSHLIAYEVAKGFPSLLKKPLAIRKPLPIEDYARILFHAGFEKQQCRMQVYVHPLPSGAEVIEWTKGTLLTSFQKQLSEKDFDLLLLKYSQELLKEIGEGPYLYTFKRLLIWGQRS